jgi:hypothetical protein
VSDPAAAVAAYQVGKQIAPQLQETQEHQQQQQQPTDKQQQQGMRLLLELVSSSTQLAGNQLQLVVRFKPRLQLQHSLSALQHKQPQQQQQLSLKDRALEDSNGSNSSTSSWWGPLLQPCHAECVLWHADVSPVTSQSSWQWDAVAGVLTVQASLPLSSLVQLALAAQRSSSSSSKTGLGGLSSSCKQPALAAQSAAAGSCSDAYVGAASSMAAAAAAAAGSGSGNVRDASAAGTAVQLNAAVVAAASCSQQAVVQAKSKQPTSSLAAAGSTGLELDRAELLAPATALLHLPSLQVPTQQLLLQHLAGAHAGHPTTLEHFGSDCIQAAPAAAATGVPSSAAPHSDGMRTPSRPVASKHNQQLLGASTGGGAASLQPSAATATGPHSSYAGGDVVPPTPYSAMQEDGAQQHEDIVIKDSQESEDHVPDSIMRDAAPAPAVAAPAAAAAAQNGHHGLQQLQQEPFKMLRPKHLRELLLQYDSAVLGGSSGSLLLLLPSVLEQQMGFAAVAGVSAAQLSQAVQQLDIQPQQQPVHMLLQLNSARGESHGSCGSSSGCSISFAWFSSRAVHVELGSSSSEELDVLQQLLLTAVHSLPGVSMAAAG